MNETIFDLRFAICDSSPAANHQSRGGHDRSQLHRLLTQCIHLAAWQQTPVDDQFHPQRRLVRLLFNRPQLRDEPIRKPQI